MRLKTIWTIPAMTVRERSRQTREWADANPQPHTITREALGRIGDIARGRFLTPHDLEWYLGGIGE